MSSDIQSLFEYVKNRFISSGGHLDVDGIRLLDEAKRKLVLHLVGNNVDEISRWLEYVKEVLDSLQERFSIKGFTLPKELASFIASPLDHMKKKLFNYVNDYLSGRLGYEDLLKKSLAALTTSLRTNARSCYQLWGFAGALLHLGNMGYHLVYPEHRFVSFDRSGKQRLGVIPPNVVLLNLERGYLSFFYEAPRPLSWEDTSDLQKVWSFYTALRPDLMVYSGRVLDIVDLGSSPPIKRPDIVVEFKELDDWYLRVRDLKGYFKKSFTAEEWRLRWWQRLREELIRIADLHHIVEAIEESRSVRVRAREPSFRVKEYQLVMLYKATYRPGRMILVSKSRIPGELRGYLEDNSIEIYDGIGFDVEKLKDVANEIATFTSYGEESSIAIEIPKELAILLGKTSKTLGLNHTEIIRYALKLLIEHFNNIEQLR